MDKACEKRHVRITYGSKQCPLCIALIVEEGLRDSLEKIEDLVTAIEGMLNEAAGPPNA